MPDQHFPLVYQVADSRRCFFVRVGDTLSIGRAPSCQICLEMEGLKDVEARILISSPTSALLLPDAQAGEPVEIPFSLNLMGHVMTIFRPSDLAPEVFADTPLPEGVSIASGTISAQDVYFTPGQPLIIGASEQCDIFVEDENMPAAMAALWPRPENRVSLHILDNSQAFAWKGGAAWQGDDKDLPLRFDLAGVLIAIHPMLVGTGD